LQTNEIRQHDNAIGRRELRPAPPVAMRSFARHSSSPQLYVKRTSAGQKSYLFHDTRHLTSQ
jgi:hypothetical protein